MNSRATPPELKRKLKLVEKIRGFAKNHLKIPVSDGYTGYVDLEKSYVTLLVTASETLELKAIQWCFWFVGCQEYRGYFNESDAKSFALELEQQKFDVSIRHVTAYSTLGWLNKSWLPDYFSDPVLNTFLLRNDADLIATLIHEMAHQIVFVKNDTTFNESFAVFVEQEGLRQFLIQFKNSDLFEGNDQEIFQWYLDVRKDRNVFRDLIKKTFNKMEIMYSSTLSESEKFQKKQELFDELRENYYSQKNKFKVLSYDNWFEKSLNNTHLLAIKRYTSRVENFSLLFEQNGRNWTAFFEAVRDLANVPKKERNLSLNLHR